MLDPQKVSMGRVRQAYGLNRNEVEKELEKLESDFVEHLPKSILQAAVQGKLVPQNVHDEPASALLERIRAEKAKLIKQGKVKKEKPLPPIAEDDVPYDLPDGWEWCRLGEVCNFGSTLNANAADIPERSWILELEDVEKDTGNLVTFHTKQSRNSLSTKHIFKAGEVLYSKLRPYLNKVLIATEDGYCTSEILPLDFGVINSNYAAWFLRSPYFVEYAKKCSYGVKMPRLGTTDGQLALFSLPPLAEQQRIVAKVDELMVLCNELKTADTLPIAPPLSTTVIPFPARATAPEEPAVEEEYLIAARGNMPDAMPEDWKQAVDDLFGEERDA